jgi:hypothetical protein
MTATATRNLVAITPGGEITADMLAGWYVLYSIPEQPVALSRVRKAFRENGLDESRLPKERRPEHVMMDACTKAQRITSNGHREEIRAQQVGRNENFVIYQMTRHVHDLKQNRVIDHEKVLRVLYSFETDELIFEPLSGNAQADVQELVDEIQSYYEAHRSRLPGRSVRTYLRHYIESAGAERIRDGAYFIAKTHKIRRHGKSTEALADFHGETIDGAGFIASVKGALAQVYNGQPDFHDIPCVNDEGQRAFLKRKFMENCAEDLKEFRDECMGLVGGKEDRKRAFRADKRTGMVARRAEIVSRREKFAEILGETLSELERDMKLADQALAKFLTAADA